MKKIILFFGLAIIMAGCNSIKSIEDNKKLELAESQSQIRSEISSVSSKDKEQKKLEVEKAKLKFVPQLDEINQGLTTENDAALAKMQKIVEENQDMGFENEVTIVYSGETFGKASNMAGIFLIINRTDNALKNMKFTYTFGGVDKNLIFNQKPFHLTVEKFGVLEPNTVMPMYFVVKPENEKDLKEIDIQQIIEKVESFKYDIAEEGDHTNKVEEKDLTTNKLQFKLPKQNSDDGQTVENNPLMSKFKKIVDETDKLGFEDDFTIIYSKLSETNEDDTAAYFLVINKTSLSMQDIRFNFSYGDAKGNMVWDKELYYMSSEVFGILEPMTVMPVTLTVPEGKQDLFFSITEDNIKTSIEDFQYNEVK